jgi:hypothetical protein
MTCGDRIAAAVGLTLAACLVYALATSSNPTRLESWCWLKAERLAGHAHGSRGEVPRCANGAALVTD